MRCYHEMHFSCVDCATGEDRAGAGEGPEREKEEEDEDGNVDEGADTEGIGSSILADMLGAVRAVRADGTDTLQVL